MAYKTHHVLIFSKDPVVLAGAGLKIARHDKAKVYLADKITSKPFPAPAFKKSDPTPWKLHVIEHGSKGSVSALQANISWQEMADWILQSGIADQPSHALPPVVRLDVCCSGLPGRPEYFAGYYAETVIQKLAAHMFQPLNNRRLSIEGCKGTCVGPWSAETGSPSARIYKKKQRQVIDPGASKFFLVAPDVNDYSTWTVWSKLPATKQPSYEVTADEFAGYLWGRILTQLKPASPNTSLRDPSAMASDAWGNYRHAVQEFHRVLEEAHKKLGGGIFLPKTDKSDYLRIMHLNKRT